MDNKVLVFTTTADHLAHLVKGNLEAGGIETLMLNQKDSAYTVFGSIELYVRPEDEEKAKAIISESQNNE